LSSEGVSRARRAPAAATAEEGVPPRRGRRPASDRRREIADAAIRVLAREGARGLNHRAIDRFLSLPDGSTSYYFPKRTELLAATAKRISDLNLVEAEWAYRQILDNPGLLDARALAEQAVGGMLRRLKPTERPRTIAYFEMTLDATRTPAHRTMMRRELDTLWQMWRHIFHSLGAHDPDRAAKSFMAFTLGHVFIFICRPDVKPLRKDLVELVHSHILGLLR
jgi:DNA-binding transcriptional regulator YbjK